MRIIEGPSFSVGRQFTTVMHSGDFDAFVSVYIDCNYRAACRTWFAFATKVYPCVIICHNRSMIALYFKTSEALACCRAFLEAPSC